VEATSAVEALGALAQESRLAVFRLLVRQGPAGMPAGRVAEALGIPPATLSFHLAQLGHAGLVLSRRDGRRIIYSAGYASMQELIAFLTEKCCQPAVRGGRARKC
jgi:DNA-binding transcriptional ArsR family regulator